MKRWALLLAVLLLPLCARAGELAGTLQLDGNEYKVYDCGGWLYFSREPGSAVIYSCPEGLREIRVPDVLDGLPVAEVLPQAIPDGTESVVFPGSIPALAEAQFYFCRETLRSLWVQDGVKEIGAQACRDCRALEQVSLPGSLVRIGEGAFSGCAALTRFGFSPREKAVIEASAFQDCAALREVNLSGRLVSLGDYAFCACGALESVALQDGLEAMGYAAFGLCESLRELDVPDSVVTFTLPLVSEGTELVTGDGSALAGALLGQHYGGWHLRSRVIYPEIAPEITDPEAKARAIVSFVADPAKSQYEQALALHDYLIQHARYGPEDSPWAHGAEGVLIHGEGVCQSYAEAYRLLLDAAGIPNALEYNDMHIWNLVCADGVWMHVDITWDDPVDPDGVPQPVYSGREHRLYFGLTDAALEGLEDHSRELREHAAADVTRSWLYRQGALNARVKEILAETERGLAAGLRDFRFTPETFDGLNHAVADRLSVEAAMIDPFPSRRVTLRYSSGEVLVHAEPE